MKTIAEVRQDKFNQILTGLKHDASKLHYADFYLFGSFSTGKWDSFSDVDIVCVSDNEFSSLDFPTITDRDVDVVCFTKEKLAKNIIFTKIVQEGIKL